MKHPPRTPSSRAGRGASPPTRGGAAKPAPRRASAPPPLLAPAAILVLVAILGADVLRIGFFADDFHFLDVARRVPLWKALAGQFGIYPWYRPLSRELYFAAITWAGHAETVAAHTLALVCVGASAWQIQRIGERLSGARVGAIAALLFLTCAITKFLAAWASGFQDLLALLLVLLAVGDQLDGRTARAAAWAFLACFAKETALVVFPILALHEALVRRVSLRRFLPLAGALGLVVAIHLAVRATWHTGGSEVRIVRSMPALFVALARLAGDFVGHAAAFDPRALALAGAGALAAATLLASSPATGAGARDERWPAGRTIAFFAAAAGLGLAPLVAGHVAGFTAAYDYYAFPATPWLALLLGLAIARIPRAAGTVAVSALVAWNIASLGIRTPDLALPSTWRFTNWDWPEAVRLSAISRRLSEDVRARLASRPESLVVLYSELKEGSYFQTEDGPATRESLRDPTVRAFFVNAPPYGLAPGAFAILSFRQESQHLELYRPPFRERAALTATSIAEGNAPAAWAFSVYGDTAENRSFDLAYFRAAAALMGEGVGGARRELAALGIADTAGPAAAALAARLFPPPSPIHALMLAALRRPLDADSHIALADVFRARRAAVSEAVELRIATTLDPRRVAERVRLARTLIALGLEPAARRELARLIADSHGGAGGAEALRLLEEMRGAAGAAGTR